jgi:hypothetical protein
MERSLRKIYAIIIVFFVGSQAALAQMGGGVNPADRAAPIFPDVDGETMIFDVPERWYPFNRRTDDMVDTYVFPAGQEPEDWEETLRQQTFLSRAGVTEPRQVFDLRSQNNQSTCSRYDTEVLGDGLENGYPMFYWRQVCETESEIVSSLNKVVLGVEQLYIISKVWKEEPRDREWTRWEEYLETVYVCDPRTAEHRCRPVRPAGMGGRGR